LCQYIQCKNEKQTKYCPFSKSSQIQSKRRRNRGSIDIVWHLICKRGPRRFCQYIHSQSEKQKHCTFGNNSKIQSKNLRNRGEINTPYTHIHDHKLSDAIHIYMTTYLSDVIHIYMTTHLSDVIHIYMTTYLSDLIQLLQ
jgi:hypothetical protein